MSVESQLSTLVCLCTLHGQINSRFFEANDHNLLSFEKLSSTIFVKFTVIKSVHDPTLEHFGTFIACKFWNLCYVTIFSSANYYKLKRIPLKCSSQILIISHKNAYIMLTIHR